MLASIPSASLLGVRGCPVTVEVYVGDGLPGYRIVGMPDTPCKESRDRVRAALASSHFVWPSRSITVNLAPTSERKTGAGLDLAIAIGVLVATQQLPAAAVDGFAFLGELGLDGTLRKVPGVAPMVYSLDAVDVVVPVQNALEAHVAARGTPRVASDLGMVVACLAGTREWDSMPANPDPDPPDYLPDLGDVRGQPVARRALEIAAAGGHHMLLIGSPGSGKTMLARRMPSLLPPLERNQSLETTMIHSAAGMRLPPAGLIRHPPFRSPHHTASVVAMVGGGSQQLRPGEASLATNGVLFMDELGEFARAALDGLRQPLEEGVVNVSRSFGRAVMPARFLLIGATNPCPCGGGPPGSCQCDDTARGRYLRRLSGPLADRFDLRVVVHRPAADALLGAEPGDGAHAGRTRRGRPARTRRPQRSSGRNRARATDGPRLPPDQAGRQNHRRSQRPWSARRHARPRRAGVVDAGVPARPGDDRLAVDRVMGADMRTGALAALAGLDLATAARLRVLLAYHDPIEALAVAGGRCRAHPAVERMLTPELRSAWSASAGRRDAAEWAARCSRVGIGAVTPADTEYPGVLQHDPQPPAVLFFRGCWSALDARRVGIVGTRNATGPGCTCAATLGVQLGEVGVTVVSGLAKGIDGAAHRGVLRSDPQRAVGVVANGLDAPYPRQHRELWNAVAESGILLSEWPPGTEPERFRFPQRNRIIAALSEVLVVVESRERGGSLTTAREALERGVDVMAVPGSVNNRAAAGTNQLIRDGAVPVTEVSDILLALGLDHRRSTPSAFDPRPLPRGAEAAVLDRCRADACTLDTIVAELGFTITDAAMTLARLERSGWVRESGGWFEEVTSCSEPC